MCVYYFRDKGHLKFLLKKAIYDPSVSVAVVAAESLYILGEKTRSLQRLLKGVKNRQEFAPTQAMNLFILIDDNSHY